MLNISAQMRAVLGAVLTVASGTEIQSSVQESHVLDHFGWSRCPHRLAGQEQRTWSNPWWPNYKNVPPSLMIRGSHQQVLCSLAPHGLHFCLDQLPNSHSLLRR